MSLLLVKVWEVLFEISAVLAFCRSRLLVKSLSSLGRATRCFPQLNTQSGRVWSLEVVSLCTKWITLCFPSLNTELDKVVMPKWLFLSWLLFVICFNGKGFVNSGKRFISFKSSIWFVIIFWELSGNILYGNSISLLSGDSEIIPAVRSFLQMGSL